ncbi:MAG TPA: MaoC family dehydratase [Jatrophihabitans sp.]|jgi:acyl dehydratase
MTVRTFTSVDEFCAIAGDEIGVSPWHRITQHDIDLFAESTGDYNWIHVDRDRAANGPYGSTIAHGYLTLSLVPKLLTHIFEIRQLVRSLNYGAERIRFPSPVQVDSSVRAKARLTLATRRDEAWLATIETVVEIAGEPKPACIASTITWLVGREVVN